jgi:hypothetical protein
MARHFRGMGDFGLDDFADTEMGADGISGEDARAVLDAISAHYTPPAERKGGPASGQTGGQKLDQAARKKKRPDEPEYRRCFAGTSNPPARGPHNAERFANLVLRVFHQLTRFAQPNFDAAADLIEQAEREFSREAERMAAEEREARLQAMNGDRHNPWI